MLKQIVDIPRTAMEVFNMLPEGTRCEVIDNTLYMSPSPTSNHQDLLLTIATTFNQFINGKALGKLYISPLDVYLDNELSVVQPDLIFVSTNNLYKVERKGIIGAPDLVIELLSSNKIYDTKQKFELYQRNGIAEYIIIDPETKEVWQYLLKDSGYELVLTETGSLATASLNLQFGF